MTKTIALYVSGLICLLLGIFFATLGTNMWSILGTLLSIVGGGMMGFCIYIFTIKE